jgi:glycosyltransferase involved in cell wall biosynthesis
MLLRRLRDTLAEESPDIVNIHNPVGLLTVQTLMAARKLKLRVVIDSHLFYANLAPYHPGKQLYYRAFKRAVHPYFRQQIRRYLPHHPEAATLLGRELGVPVALMTEITLGTDIERFHFDPGSRTRIRDEMGLPPDAVVAIFVGRLTHDKDIDVLLRAATPLLPEHNLWLLAVGPVEDRYRRRLLSIVPEKLQERVRFPGYVRNEDLPAYYSAADVGVWPGVAAISIIDALACGLPVVISRSEVTRHLISADNGICFTRGNVGELRRGLEAVISEGALRREMGARSRGLAERVFAWERVAARTIDVYHAVLEGRPVEVAPLWEVT